MRLIFIFLSLVIIAIAAEGPLLRKEIWPPNFVENSYPYGECRIYKDHVTVAKNTRSNIVREYKFDLDLKTVMEDLKKSSRGKIIRRPTPTDMGSESYFGYYNNQEILLKLLKEGYPAGTNKSPNAEKLVKLINQLCESNQIGPSPAPSPPMPFPTPSPY